MSDFSLDVLQHYFDDLLTPEPQPLADTRLSPGVTHVAIEDDPARQKLARLLASRPLMLAEEAAAPSATAAGVPAQSQSAASVDAVVPAAAPVCAPENPVPGGVGSNDGWAANGRPHWAQERFDVLLFEVAGLTLAVPLMSLGQIQPLTDELTPLFGQAEWFMGLQPTPMGKIRTINTARFVMPERYQQHFIDAARYVVSIAGLPWGLAVDAVNQPITLHPEDVRWRTERSKRPWLAGTVKQHMCALLDVETMGRLLQHAEQSRSRHDPLRA